MPDQMTTDGTQRAPVQWDSTHMTTDGTQINPAATGPQPPIGSEVVEPVIAPPGVYTTPWSKESGR